VVDVKEGRVEKTRKGNIYNSSDDGKEVTGGRNEPGLSHWPTI
jgi:hypothetical protein